MGENVRASAATPHKTVVSTVEQWNRHSMVSGGECTRARTLIQSF